MAKTARGGISTLKGCNERTHKLTIQHTNLLITSVFLNVAMFGVAEVFCWLD